MNGERHRECLKAQKKAEDDGSVADSLDIRIELIAKMKAGKMTFDQMQAELKRIKRNAKKNGQVTRSQAYRGY